MRSRHHSPVAGARARVVVLAVFATLAAYATFAVAVQPATGATLKKSPRLGQDDCWTCIPPAAPPPRCNPVSQVNGPWAWDYQKSRTLKWRGHGSTTREYMISHDGWAWARKVTCTRKF